MGEEKRHTVYLVDASGFIFRAYHAIRGGLATSTGIPTNAVYGFLRLIIKLVRERNPEWLIPVFDVSRKTFRNEIYPEYKANRPPPPDDLLPQFALVREIVEMFSLPAVELEGFEADDIIGTLAKRFHQEGYEVCIVTSDKDMMQLVGEQVYLYDSWKDKEIRAAEVEDKFGVAPKQVIDVLALAGDTSDNVPGVPGVGVKTATALIQEHGDVEGVLANIDKIKGKKRKENLTNYAEQARLSRELVTIKLDVPLDIKLENFTIQAPEGERATALLKKLEFDSMLKDVLAFGSSDTSQNDYAANGIERDKYRLINTEEDFRQFLTTLEKAELIAFDTETTGLDVIGKKTLVGMSFAIGENDAYYLPLRHNGLGAQQLDCERTLESLRPIFENEKTRWVMQNAKFDMHVMQAEGIRFKGIIEDTMLISYAINPAKRGHGLDKLALEYLEHKMISYEEVTGKGKKQISFADVDVKTATRYAAEDADITLRLFHLLENDAKQGKAWALYEDLERPLVAVLQAMEAEGIFVDKEALQSLSEEFLARMQTIEEEIYEYSGYEFNINSTKALSDVLFHKLGLTPGKKTKTGYSTDSSVLEKLAQDHPLPSLVLDYRQLAKLRSTYTEALQKLIHDKTGRIHTSFHQTIALTGRLSSSEPNVQNIPIRTEEGRKIRQSFIPKSGCKLVAADYSQVELRVLAHISEDEILIDAFKKDEDIHTRTASEVFMTMPALVDKEMRRRAKAVNFGIVYGQSAFGLSESLGITRAKANNIINSYFDRYKGVKNYLDHQREEAQTTKKVETLFGRVIPLADIDSRNPSARGYAERVAINAPIQGTAADIIKRAMVSLQKRLSKEEPEAKPLLQVHDELVLEVPDEKLDAVCNIVKEEMENAAELAVPLKVDIGVGDNWEQAH